LSKRSIEISTHFHAHITQIAKELSISRYIIYWNILIKAIEIEVDGGAPYPYIIRQIKTKSPITGELILCDAVQPYTTSKRTNRQMMTAVEACHIYAVEREIVLKEKCPFCKGDGCTTCNYTGMEQ